MLRRVVGLVALAMGLVGVVACTAGAYGVWKVQTRLNSANDKVFDAIDRGLNAAQDRIPVARQRVQQAKLTTDDVKDALGAWARRQAEEEFLERLAAKLEIDRRADQLAGHLNAVDLRLDASEMAVRDVRQLLEIGQNLGADVDPTATDDVLELLASLQAQLKETQETVNEVRRLTDTHPKSVQDRLARVVKLLARVVATFADIDSRLDRCAARLSELRANAQQLHEKTSRWILQGALVSYGLLAWMAAAQAALARFGFQLCFRRRTPTSAPAGRTS